jgi:Domain of unknown function (DUF6089)
MKSILFPLLLLVNICSGQEWQAEVMVGVSGYNGDLTEREVAFNRLRPAGNFKLIYNTNDFINFRLGIGYGKLAANDKNNKAADLKNRNLSFRSDIFEVTLCAEFNLFDPTIYKNYPYIFTGVGLFHFNPYAFDNDNKKTYLHPLNTEGQGLTQYPDKKNYSLTQFCIPLGFGWKIKRKNWEIGYEFGYRLLFTDYLDDVSKTYVSLEALMSARGPKAVEMSFRGLGGWAPDDGGVRGNSQKRDTYFFNGLRLATSLSKHLHKKKMKGSDKRVKDTK